MKKKYLIITFIFFFVDLISKIIMSKILEVNESIKIIKNFFYITLAHNSGAAFSILKDQQILLIIITVIALFYIYKYMNKEDMKRLEGFAFSMITGGILGNLFDRIIYNYVIDFLDFKIFGYDYPIFNFADTFIVIGVILLVINYFKELRYERSNSRRK
ncbi:MAG: signal peptidase II [Bacilli bacterium]|nr:signal peptidase II [Bacilli bacterium]